MYSLVAFALLLTVIVSLLWIIWAGTHNELKKYGSFVNYVPPFPSQEKFTPFNKSEFPTMLLNHIVLYQTEIILLLVFMTSLLFTLAVFIVLHVLKQIKKLEQWDKDYLNQAYLVNFQTTVPSGNTTGEKILNLAKSVYPELRSDYAINPSILEHVERIWQSLISKKKSEEEALSKSLNYKINSYTLDLALKTPSGYFIVKDFKDKVVALSDLKELGRIIQNKFGSNNIFRVIIVAKKYDVLFLEPKSLREQMLEKLSLDFNLDLLLEEEKGYSVLWIGNIWKAFEGE